MSGAACLLLAVLSVWDFPSLQPRHAALRRELLESLNENDAETMCETCESAVKILPGEPIWQYNLACAYAKLDRKDDALRELEKAIRCGYRAADAIAADKDFTELAEDPRFIALVIQARKTAAEPLPAGPFAPTTLEAALGARAVLTGQNVAWNFDLGLFEARLKLTPDVLSVGNSGDLYLNRDGGHAALDLTHFPGLTAVSINTEGKHRNLVFDLPNMLFPYPTFGNASRAQTHGPYWRSLPRELVTTRCSDIGRMAKLYVSNQLWFFPANADIAPVGTNGDVFASITPYCVTTAGRSWSDLPYLEAALTASKALDRQVKTELVRRGLLAPTVFTLLRRSLKAVQSDEDYFTAKAHPTAFPPNGLDLARLRKLAGDLSVEKIAPLAFIGVKAHPTPDKPVWPECTYVSPFASAFVLRSAETNRVFDILAQTAWEYRFAVTHDPGHAATLTKLKRDVARVVLDKSKMSVTSRVDVAVFARNTGTDWSAPSYVSFAVVDPKAPYSDPALTPLDQPKAEAPDK